MPFVSFEGVDGGGKTTQLRLLGDWLDERGETVTRTREPGGGPLGIAVRDIFTTPGRTLPLSPTEELLLINAARYGHVRSVIRPALARGEWVLTDRFVDSTYALQVHGTTVPEALFKAVIGSVVGDTFPDLTLVLDLEPAIARDRLRSRDANDDPAEQTRNFERIRQGYHRLAEREPDRCRLIDAARDEAQVAEDIRRAVELLIASKDSSS
jgi:dTMP kinase